MKKALFILSLITFSLANYSQNLIVGLTNPNEVKTISSGNHFYDTVIVVQNGSLKIEGGVFKTKVLAVANNGKLEVENSDIQINKAIYCNDYGKVMITDSITLACDILLNKNAEIQINAANVHIPMTYKNQYSWFAAGNAELNIDSCSFDLGSGALSGGFSGNSSFIQTNTTYNSSILPMTISLSNQSKTYIDNCMGGMELVLYDSAKLDIKDSRTFVIWYTFDEGQTASYTLPPNNSVFDTMASDITSKYEFPGNAIVSNVNLNVSIENTARIYWGLISRENSDVIINNSNLIACGLFFDGNADEKVSGFKNNLYYTNYTTQLSDRNIVLKNSRIAAWNFYTAEKAHLVIEDCYYGESLTFGESKIDIYNSTCDGTGGYWGGQQNSEHNVYHSILKRKNGSDILVNIDGNNISRLFDSEIDGDIIINENANMFLYNTDYNTTPVVNDNGYFLSLEVDTFYMRDFEEEIEVFSKTIRGANNNSKITRYIFEYSDLDSTNRSLLKDSSALDIDLNGTLGLFNDKIGIQYRSHLLWTTVFVDSVKAFEFSDLVRYDVWESIEENQNSNITIFPNPTQDIFTIQLENNEVFQQVEIFNIEGKLLKSEFNNQTIDVSGFPEGDYLIRVKTDKSIYHSKIIKTQ